MTADKRPQTHRPISGQAVDGRPQSSAVRVRRAFKLRFAVPLLVIGAVVILVLGRSLWLPVVGRFLIVADPLQPADAMVVLAGGQQRVIYGARLFGEGHARWFVATNMPLNVPGVRSLYGELVRQEALWQGVPEDRILLAPGTVETTYQEAIAVGRLAQEQGWRSLIVVTDPFHTRRSRMAFRDAFRGTGITVVVHPVRDHWYSAESWWQTLLGQRLTWTEYLALGLYLVGYR